MSIVAPLSLETSESSPLPKMTFEEFLKWAGEDLRQEWVGGMVSQVPRPDRSHQEILLFLLCVVGTWNEVYNGGFVISRFLMRLNSEQGESARQPDLLYVAPENKGRITEYFVDGPADIVVEVISQESKKTDRNTKYFEYEKAGVREYWILDPNKSDVEFYRLSPHGRYERVELEDGIRYHSAVLNGFTLDVSWLWQRPLPSVGKIVKEWDGPVSVGELNAGEAAAQ